MNSLLYVRVTCESRHYKLDLIMSGYVKAFTVVTMFWPYVMKRVLH